VAQVTAPPTHTRVHDGEVIGDFAAVGTLAAVDVLVRHDVDNGVGTMLVLGGMVGGAAGGWLLTEKFKVDEGSARATTIGLLAGAANGALLIQPTGWERPSSVLGLLVAGSAIGAGGGFIYGQAADLTGGQATFVGNITILGSATAALAAIAGSTDDKYGSWENGTLALGLDAGLVAGALIAPHLDWSKRRSRITFAASGIGALAGGMVAGLASKKMDGSGESDPDANVVAACMTIGMWSGFGLGILMTHDSAPDPKLATPATGAAASTAYAPWVAEGQLGVMAAGSW
jgi:hypothetical protein